MQNKRERSCDRILRCLPAELVGTYLTSRPLVVITEPHEDHAPQYHLSSGNEIPGRLGIITKTPWIASVTESALPSSQHASKLLSRPWVAHPRAQEQDCERSEALIFSTFTSSEERRTLSLFSSWAEWSDDRVGCQG